MSDLGLFCDMDDGTARKYDREIAQRAQESA